MYLAPILRKLDSSAPARQKTVEILGSLAKRVRSEAAVPIPVAAVLEIWAGPEGGPVPAPPSDLLRTMGMIFVEMGIARMSKDNAAKVLPLLVRGIGEGSGPWKASVFGVFLSVGYRV